MLFELCVFVQTLNQSQTSSTLHWSSPPASSCWSSQYLRPKVASACYKVCIMFLFFVCLFLNQTAFELELFTFIFLQSQQWERVYANIFLRSQQLYSFIFCVLVVVHAAEVRFLCRRTESLFSLLFPVWFCEFDQSERW